MSALPSQPEPEAWLPVCPKCAAFIHDPACRSCVDEELSMARALVGLLLSVIPKTAFATHETQEVMKAARDFAKLPDFNVRSSLIEAWVERHEPR